MDLPSIRDAFNRVAKKQKVWYGKTHENVDKVLDAITDAIAELSKVSEEALGIDHKSVMEVLQARLREVCPQSHAAAPMKDTNLAMTKCGKLIDKCFNPDLAKAYRDVEFDNRLINQLVALHFYRQGLFSLGDCFVTESQEGDPSTLKAPFFEMYQILEQMRVGNLGPALTWAQEHRLALEQKKSSLEFKLQKLQFVQFLERGDRSSALDYARSSFRQFADNHMPEIQRLMGGLLWAGRLQVSPYSDILAATHWEAIALEFTRECCAMLGQSYESPLLVTISAGSQALPTLLKLATVMATKKHEWQSMRQVPVEIELDKGFQFHSIFACPVSRDQSTAENPPMLLPCGHVLCKQSIQKLAKGHNRTFKCPYCPSETTISLCRQLYF